MQSSTHHRMDPTKFQNDWLPKFLDQFKDLDSDQKETTILSLLDILESKEKYILQSSLPNLLYRDFVNLLPYEILEKVLDYVEFEDILNCCMVSKSWNQRLSNFSSVWKNRAIDMGLEIPESMNSRGNWKEYALKGKRLRFGLKNASCFTHHSLSKLITSVGTSFSAGKS